MFKIVISNREIKLITVDWRRRIIGLVPLNPLAESMSLKVVFRSIEISKPYLTILIETTIYPSLNKTNYTIKSKELWRKLTTVNGTLKSSEMLTDSLLFISQNWKMILLLVSSKTSPFPSPQSLTLPASKMAIPKSWTFSAINWSESCRR